MALLPRALLTWFLVMSFLVLLALRLDQRTYWSWFIVFIPLWFYSAIVLIAFILRLVSECRRSDRNREPLENACAANLVRVWDFFFTPLMRGIVAILLLVTFMALLCLKLEGLVTFSWLVVFSPFLIVLFGVNFGLGQLLSMQYRGLRV